ncbi:hypothetical protein H4W01_001382 [Sphingomonas sp. PL20]
MQVAWRDVGLEAVLTRLDKYHLLILDDLAHVTKDQAETSVLFELIRARYERRSTLITANQPFGEWGRIFPDPAMTLAAVDRLVHHATIFEMNVESYRRRTAFHRQLRAGRPPTYATIKTIEEAAPSANQRATISIATPPRSRSSDSHPDRRYTLIQIVALQPPANLV